MKVTILGCGSSTGVPVIGCKCDVCLSDNPKNKRSRVSLLIETHGKKLLIDSSPDLRAQALRHGIDCIDALLYTHEHADHTHGLDDLRSFNYLSDKAIPIYCDKKTYDSISSKFSYAFLEKPPVWFRPCLSANILEEGASGSFDVLGIPVTYFKQLHGKTTSLGYRIGNFAYSTDTDGLEPSAFEALSGVKVWVVDCLRYTPSLTHASLPMTLEWIQRVKPELAILTHMAHEFDYDRLSNELPPGVAVGNDGMAIEMTEPA